MKNTVFKGILTENQLKSITFENLANPEAIATISYEFPCGYVFSSIEDLSNKFVEVFDDGTALIQT